MDTLFPPLDNGTFEPHFIASVDTFDLADWQDYFARTYFADDATAQSRIYDADVFEFLDLIDTMEEQTSGYSRETSETVWIHYVNNCFMLSPGGCAIDVDTRTGSLACFPIGDDVEQFRQNDTLEV